MREIKFRAWDKTENHMYKWENLLNQNLKNIFTIPKQCGYNIMQFTGLHDKNGKEIYEGDIVSFNLKSDSEGQPYIIGYIEYQTTFSGYRIMSFEGSFALDYNIKDIEVIGNIYDNPELLEK